MKTNWRHECNVLNDPVSASIIVGSLVSAGSSVNAANKQKRLAEDDAKKREESAAREQAKLDRIAADTRPDGEMVGDTKIEFGSDGDSTGSYNDFLVDKSIQPKMTNSNARAGLGFNV